MMMTMIMMMMMMLQITKRLIKEFALLATLGRYRNTYNYTVTKSSSMQWRHWSQSMPLELMKKRQPSGETGKLYNLCKLDT